MLREKNLEPDRDVESLDENPKGTNAQSDTGLEFGICDQCEQPIRAGESYWCMDLSHEVFERGAVSFVDDNVVAFYWCEHCANTFSFNELVLKLIHDAKFSPNLVN